MGSVKDLDVIKSPTPSEYGTGNFVFSDRYSVFDWGEMPDQISEKGKALCLIGAHFFEKLEEMGVPTHYLGLVENGEVKRLQQLEAPVDTMQVKLVQVIKPIEQDGTYDYSMYKERTSNFLVPLEVIYRNSLPEGSSVFKRLKAGSITPADMGLTDMPVAGQILDRPMMDVSTKLEATDRYMTWQEAQEISGISDGEIGRLQQTALEIDDLITQEARKMDLVHEDGKIEFGINENGQIMLVDVLGTPDECRFTFNSIPVSKEAARVFYRSTPWYQDVEAAKKEDNTRWKELVGSPPPSLPEKLATLISGVYLAFCNELTGKNWFETPPLKDVLSDLQAELKL